MTTAHTEVRSSTALLLEQWARWARLSGTSLSYNSVDPVIKLQGSTVPTPWISDDEALRVDKAVAQLNLHNKFIGEIIICSAGGMSYTGIGKRMSISRHQASIYVKMGIAWVDGYLS